MCVFPSDFMWGVATAAFQVEGGVTVNGKLSSIWDQFTRITGTIADNSTADVACNSYNMYAEDMKLARDIGVRYYRMSVAWTRLINEDGTVNDKGVEHYLKMFQMMWLNQITPVVTLYHWDMPLVFSEMQQTNSKFKGWLNESIVEKFGDYARIAFSRFGNYVKHWTTINEPISICVQGYEAGVFAPGRCSNRSKCEQGDSAVEPYICGHNILRAHARAVQIYKTEFAAQGGVIGITLNSIWAEPQTSTFSDLLAAERSLIWQLGWFADPIYFGDYPDIMKQMVGSRLPSFTSDEKVLLKGSNDFFGLNHCILSLLWLSYPDTSQYVANMKQEGQSWTLDQNNVVLATAVNGSLIGPKAASVWLYVVPWGFRPLLNWISNRYSNPDIIITENGVDVPGESDMVFPQVLNDQFRVDYMETYLSSVHEAITLDKVNVRGYFAVFLFLRKFCILVEFA